MNNQDSLFLTQGMASSRVRKITVQNYISQTENNEVTEVYSKTEELLAMILETKPQESISQYRQLKRQMRQARIVAESEVTKMEKCFHIDLEYSRKCIAN